MTSRPEILNEIMFYILEGAKCEENTDKYLDHVLDYCKKDYQKAYKKQNVLELAMDEIKQSMKTKEKMINHLELSSANKEYKSFPFSLNHIGNQT